VFIADCRLQDGLGCGNTSTVVDRLVAPLHAIPVGRILFITYCSRGPRLCASLDAALPDIPLVWPSAQACRDECKSVPMLWLIRSRTISTFRYTFINCIVYPQHAGSLDGHCGRILIAWRQPTVRLIGKPFERGYQPGRKEGPDTGVCTGRSEVRQNSICFLGHSRRHLASCVHESPLSARQDDVGKVKGDGSPNPTANCRRCSLEASPNCDPHIQSDRQPDHPPSNSAEPWRRL
jgi:hypothetical protein